MEVLMGVFAVFYVLMFAIADSLILAFSVVCYVLEGKSLSAIARRRGIEKPWLAWVPVGADWLLGCISDQYRYVVHGQERNARGKLLKLGIIGASGMMIVSFIVGIVTGLGFAEASEEVTLVPVLLLILLCYAQLAVLAVYLVAYYKAMFDLYRSCDPKKSLVFLLVSIFVTYPGPFFLFACRTKDLGMPPRQEPEQLPEAE